MQNRVFTRVQRGECEHHIVYCSFLLFMLQCSLTTRAYDGYKRRRETFRSINVRAQRNSTPEQEAVKLTRRRRGGGYMRACCVSSIAMCACTQRCDTYVTYICARVKGCTGRTSEFSPKKYRKLTAIFH